MAHDDDQTKLSRRQIVGTAALGAAGVAGSIGLTKTIETCLLYTSPSPRDKRQARMPSSA